MSEFGRPYKTQEELLENVVDLLGDLTDKMTNLADTLSSTANDSERISESFGKPKTQKGLDSLFKTVTQLGKSSIQAFALEQLVKLLEPFLSLLEPIAVVFDILSGLFSVLSAEIMKDLFDMMQPVYDLLSSLTPVFSAIGKFLSPLITVGFIPLKIIFELLNAILKPFLPMFERLAPLFELVGLAMAWLIKVTLVPLVGAIYGVGLAIAALINFFSFGIVDAIGGWNSLMLPILGSLIGLESGGIVQQEGVYRLGEGGKKEAVVPLERGGGMLGGASEEHLSDIKGLMEEQIILQRKQMRGIQRRRYG